MDTRRSSFIRRSSRLHARQSGVCAASMACFARHSSRLTPSARTSSLQLEQSPLRDQQVGEAEKREQLCHVLRQPPVAHLLEPEAVLAGVDSRARAMPMKLRMAWLS